MTTPTQTPAAEVLTLDRLVRTAVQVALTTPEGLAAEHDWEREDRAVQRVQVLLTPKARLELAAELLAGVPQVPAGARLSLGMSDEAMALIVSLGGVIDRDMAMSGGLPVVREWALLRVWGLEVQAIGEQRAVTMADLEPGGPWSPARATRGQAGIAVGDAMAGAGLLATVAVLLIMAGPLWGGALLVFALCVGSVFARPRPTPLDEPAVTVAEQERLCHGSGRVRRPMSSAVQPHRHQRGSIGGAVLALLGGGAIVALIVVAALTWAGCGKGKAIDRFYSATTPAAEAERCKGDVLRHLAFDLSMALGSDASDRATGAKPDPKLQQRIEGLRSEYRRIEKEGCGLEGVAVPAPGGGGAL